MKSITLVATDIARRIPEIKNDSVLNNAGLIENLIREALTHNLRADFLFPPAKDSLEEAAYEFANAKTEECEQMWWRILQERAKRKGK